VITALMPVKDHDPRLLREAIGSLAAQTSPRWRLLVIVEPGDVDAFEALLADALGDERVELVANEGRKLAGAFNTGMRRAETEYVGVLLGDDMWAPHAVETLLRHIDARPEVDFFHSSRCYVDARGERLGEELPSSAGVTLADFFRGAPVKHLMCWRRERALSIGGMDESLNNVGPDDFDFPWTMAEHGAVFGSVPDCLYLYRQHSECPRLTTHLPKSVHKRELARMLRKHGVGRVRTRLKVLKASQTYMRGMPVPVRPPHLLEVGLRWPPETFVQRKLQGLARLGYQITVASPANPDESRARVPGVELLRVPHWNASPQAKLLGALVGGARLLLSDPRKLRTLRRAIRESLPRGRRGWREELAALRQLAPLARLEPDVVHFEWESAAVDHLPLLDVWDAPTVVSCHGSGVSSRPHDARWGERWLAAYPLVFRRAAAVHCVADAVAANAQRYGLEPDKARIIRPGIDPTAFCPAPREEESTELRLVTVARLIWCKGYEYALVAIARLVEEGVPVRYEILGTDPPPGIGEVSDRPRMEHAIADLGLGGRVRLSGHLPPDEVRAALCRADVCLHPSLDEGLATVIAEAMSCGLPVVATDVGGTRELVRDGVDGFVVPPRDPDALAGGVRRLWGDAGARRRMGVSARERIRADFTLDEHVQRFAELYAAVVRGPAGVAS
jgi:glycosyltransferase involved in cell wall biosynthesis/GT2 family glycosyltransferase